MIIRSIKRIKKFSHRTVLIRVDYNVPMEKGKIVDDERLLFSVETIKYFLQHNCRIILISHLGRPKGRDKKLSLYPIARRLKKILDHKVLFISGVTEDKVEKRIQKMKEGEIILLENLRFYSGELKNDKKFAQRLASFADIYVNEAFSVSHRNQASVSVIQNYLPSYAGLFLEKEIKSLERVFINPKPLILVMGGAKLKTKLPLIKKLYSSSQYVLVGGGIANSFLKYEGKEIGKSLYDKENFQQLSVFYNDKKRKKKIIIPSDVVVQIKKMVMVKKVEDIKKGDIIYDIGPETINNYSQYIKKAQTLVSNGPMGKFEKKQFSHGTLAIIRLIASRSTGRAYGVIGGGDTIRALKLTKMKEYMDWVSSGGGASLAYLAKEKMPGLIKLIKK